MQRPLPLMGLTITLARDCLYPRYDQTGLPSGLSALQISSILNGRNNGRKYPRRRLQADETKPFGIIETTLQYPFPCFDILRKILYK